MGEAMGQYGKPILIGLLVLFVVSFALTFLGGAADVDPGLAPMLCGLVAGGISTYLLANLAGTKAQPAASDEQKQAALAPPSAGRSRILVARQGFVAMAAGLNITIDGRLVTQLKSPQWTALDVEPSAHSLRAAFTGLAGKQSKAVDTAFEVQDGEIAVFVLNVSLGALKNTVSVKRTPLDDILRQQLLGQKMVAPAA